MAGLPLIPAYFMIGKLLKRQTEFASLITFIGILGLVVQLSGLLRWTFVVPVVAHSSVTAITDAAREAAAMGYDILIDCGLRRDELRMLPKTRVDFKTMQIRIAELTDTKGRKWKPKTKRSTRWVPLSKESAGAIKKLMAKYPDTYYLLPSLCIDNKLDPRGEIWLQMEFDSLRAATIERFPRTRTSLTEKIGNTNLYTITLHSFRHTYASRLLQGGFPIHLVGQLMGHSDSFVTEKYAKFAKATLMEAALYLDRRRNAR